MGILDDAIKEHLELKRQHGADESELQQLEDEAFGEAERPGDETPPPDPFSEAPTEFMTPPDAPAGEDTAAEADAPPEPDAPPEAEPTPEGPEPEAPAGDSGRPEPRAEIADLQEPPAAPTGPSTEEREAIAEQPTEMFDVAEELGGLDEGGEVEVVQPADEDDEDEVDDDFWNEQRLSDELDQALEAPLDEDEDVLEETPNFLEEDSEGDQLWFEQKPPKDFDFDD